MRKKQIEEKKLKRIFQLNKRKGTLFTSFHFDVKKFISETGVPFGYFQIKKWYLRFFFGEYGKTNNSLYCPSKNVSFLTTV
jgi:hypothetical protein